MMKNSQILDANKENYQVRYSNQQSFLRYPADWIIRFHNMYLKRHIPSGCVLDHGCGSGNNSIFFIEQGYETYGTEVADAALPLIRANLESRNLDTSLAERFSIISPSSTSLPFEDEFFDVIVSNQVLYYLPSEEHIRRVCEEFSRCLRSNGVVFFTMMGPRNYYITHYSEQIHAGQIYEVSIGGASLIWPSTIYLPSP